MQMRTLYFDCFAGISGDMTLGALVAAGADARELMERLALLDVPGYEIEFETVDRSGISATRAIVRLTKEEKHHRHLTDIEKIIGDSRLGDSVKERALKIFGRLAEAEARVHNVPVERIHFHEVGAVDAIVDVVGACIGFELLGVERFVSSALHVGSGMVEMAHGRFPVPPPAVAELLRDAPIYSTDIKGELVTPTGAAIVATVCESFGALPLMRVEATGYGAGTREYKNFPNVLRVIVGETEDASRRRAERADGDGRGVADVRDERGRRLAAGARPPDGAGARARRARLLLHAGADEEEPAGRARLDPLPPVGARGVVRRCSSRRRRRSACAYYEVERRALERESVTVETEFGTIAVKVARRAGACWARRRSSRSAARRRSRTASRCATCRRRRAPRSSGLRIATETRRHRGLISNLKFEI